MLLGCGGGGEWTEGEASRCYRRGRARAGEDAVDGRPAGERL